MRNELFTQQLETYGNASIQESSQWFVEQPMIFPLALVVTGAAFGLWKLHQHILDYARRKRVTKRFADINEHGNQVPSPDEFAQRLKDLRLSDYASDTKLREEVRGSIERVKATKRDAQFPGQKGDGNTRP